MKGLGVSVYRDTSLGDCSNYGVTCPEAAEGKRFVIFDPTLEGHIDLEEAKANPDCVCLKVIRRNIGGEYLHVEPMFGRPEGMAGPMFGGNYVMTSDSRFGEAFGRRPLPVHDRWETWEQNEALSR